MGINAKEIIKQFRQNEFRQQVDTLIHLAKYDPKGFEKELQKIKDAEYKNGREKGIEMSVKKQKEKLGLDFPGKTLEDLLDAHAKKVLSYVKKEKA